MKSFKSTFFLLFISLFCWSQTDDDYHKIFEYDDTFLHVSNSELENVSNVNVEKAIKYFLSQQYQLTIDMCSEALKPDSLLYTALAFKAKAYIYLSRYNDAIEDLNIIITNYPQKLGAYIERGNTFLILNDTASALSDFSKVISVAPILYTPYYQRAKIYFNQNNYSKALVDITKFIELRPDISYGYFLRSLINFETNEVAVKNDLEKAISINNTNPSFYHQLGWYYYNTAKMIKSIKYYSKAIEVDSLYYHSYNNRANSYYSLRLNNKAIMDCNTAIRLSPNMKSYFIRASIYERKRKYQEAIIDYSNSIKFDSTFSFHFTQYVLLNRANLYSKMKKYNLADRDYKIYLLKYPDNFVPQDYYFVKMMQNDVTGLIDLYTRDISLNPANGYAYYSRAVYKEQIGDEKGAYDDYKKAKSLGVKR